MKELRKITLKAIMSSGFSRPTEHGIYALCDIAGSIDKIVEKVTLDGTVTAFVGAFEALNRVSGEVFSAPRLELPEGLAKYIVNKLGGGLGKFAINVKSELNADGFRAIAGIAGEFVPAESDPLDGMREQMGQTDDPPLPAKVQTTPPEEKKGEQETTRPRGRPKKS